ncbi:MAG: hypothetical protein Q7K55_06730 [Candidatus Levybacteria bacterium]|nr:hypothetical protein [Candidatus Levybacteria bacterium]
MITISRKLELETISAITLAAFLGIFLAMYNNNHRPKFSTFSIIPVMQEDQTSTASSLPAAPVLPKPQITSQISSDGIKQVIMKTTYNKDDTQTYTFSTTDGVSASEQIIISKTLDNTKTMSIPFNTWSPDNKYFFVQEQTKDGAVTGALVFKALGEPFSIEEKYFDVTDLFNKRNTGNNFSQTTGWASETLIIINTTTPTNAKGPSYWFEIPSKAIIQLSTEF